MTAVPAPTLVFHREEWADDDFDIPDGHPIAASDAESDKEDDGNEDWDAEMNLGPTGGARVGLALPARVQTASLTLGAKSGFIPFAALAAAVSAPRPTQDTGASDDDTFDEDEGVSTIKLTSGPTLRLAPRTPPRQSVLLVAEDDDLESDFALPSDLSQLSLRPLEPHHPAKAVLEWGDKDQTSSSTCSSDAYSNLGLGIGASPSSFGTSASQPETETEDDDDEGILDGLVIPAGLFDTGKGGKELVRLLDIRKNMAVIDERVRIASPEEDDFELGLVIDDDVDLSPSRLLTTQKLQTGKARAKTAPTRTSQTGRPPSRLRNEVGQSARSQTATEPVTRPRNSRSPTFVRPRPPSRTQLSAPPVSLKRSEAQLRGDSSHPMPRSHTSTGLRSQKSHGVLNPPPGPPRPVLQRKASLSTLLDTSTAAGPSTSTVRNSHLAPPTIPKSASSMTLGNAARYDSSTSSSRARGQMHSHFFQSSSRLYAPEFRVPPTRPSTPASNPAALRLTMPTASSRAKARPAISSVFTPTTPVSAPLPSPAPSSVSGRSSVSPLPYARPPSASDRPTSRAQIQTHATIPVARPLRRPKRARQYGDGTELDRIEDLPTDRDKERKYRVAPKPVQTSRPALRSSPSGQGTVGRRSGRDTAAAAVAQEPPKPIGTLRRQPLAKTPDSPTRRKRTGTVTNLGSRKPTLIRNLGTNNAPKVVGDMKWNPQTLRWEGNEQVLRDFDSAVGSSTRPALITHLTGSSMGSPVGSFAGGARVVGNMIFDPNRMCWISRLPPEEDEPDVFADMADDEDDDDGKGGTIRAAIQVQTSIQGGVPQTPGNRISIREESPSPAASSRHSRAFSDTSDGEQWGPSSSVIGLDKALVDATKAAELRHRAEMKGWLPATPSAALPGRPPSRQLMDLEPDREHLWFIRAVATKNYEASS